MGEDLKEMLQQICREKDLPDEVIFQALEKSLIQAVKRNYNVTGKVAVELGVGRIRVISQRTVVDGVANPEAEICLAEAKKVDPDIKVGHILQQDVTPRDFSRIAATMARQVLVQTIKDAEREHVYDDFSSIVGEIRTAIVQRREGGSVVVSLDRTDAFLRPSEQVPGEPYRVGDRIKVYILEARRSSYGPQVNVSRSHPRLVSRLFEMEVPEVHDGVVEIKTIAREPGGRTKLAVTSRDDRVDPVGSCVGHRGGRVQAVVNELYGERIDIIEWSSDIVQFVTAALQPAHVSTVTPSSTSNAVDVVVPDNQLSLAIGKHGQNVRLAARLTGWRIDIKSELQLKEAQIHEQQTTVRAAASRQLSARHYQPWGWPAGSALPAAPVCPGLVPFFDGGVFLATWSVR